MRLNLDYISKVFVIWVLDVIMLMKLYMYKCMLCLLNKYYMIGYYIEKSYRIFFVILFNINIFLIIIIYNVIEV